MCGIAGTFGLDGRSANESLVASMLELIAHRGPDDAGLLVDGPCALGHRRLSIIDVSSAGHQPMSSADGRLWITYNGEIYNYKELRVALEALGRRFRTQTDTEVLLQAYEEWGKGAFERLNGMFAFALWNRERESLLCVRDRFGVKPFYYATAKGSFRFASEIKALFADPELPRVPNDDRVLDFLAWGVADHTSDTMFAGVSQLPAGSFLEVNARRGVEPPTRWYKPQRRSAADPVAEVRQLLESAVDLRLRSDVPVGIALSGGMDSSSVLAVATERERWHDRPAPASFSSRSVNPEVDEFRYTRALLATTGSPNAESLPPGDELVHEVDSLLWHLDEPVHGPMVWAYRRMLELVRRRGIVVLLDGSGGDEALSGYHHVHYAPMLLELLRRGRVVQFAREVHARRAVLGVSYARTAKDLLKLVLPQARRSRPPHWLANHHRVPDRPRSQWSLRHHQRFALERMPLPLYNRCGDRMSMSLSIEARNPFLDFRLVETGLSLDVSDLLHLGATKWVLREAMRGVLPPEIVDRFTKQGFTSDEGIWMREGLGEDLERTFASDTFARRPYWVQGRVLELLREHREGVDNSFELWRAYAIERWLRLFVDAEDIVAPAPVSDAPTPVPLTDEKIVRLETQRARAATA